MTNLLRKTSRNMLLSRSFHEEKIYNINGLKLNTVRCGEGDKTVVLLPGTLGTALTDFGPQLKQLPKLLPNHKIIAWDPPGFGKSVPPERVFNANCFKNDANCVVDLMRSLACEKCSLLGWSAGGMTALIIAGRYPELVDKLVVWGAGPKIDAKDMKAAQALRDMRNLSARMRESLEQVYGPELCQKLWHKCMDTIDNFYTEHNGDVCIEETKNIQAPTFILRGKKDMVSSEDHLNFFFQNLPYYKFFEFPEGKHNIHLRYAEKFNELVSDFLLQDTERLKKDLKNENLTIENNNL